ncbi:MAG: YlbF family regulator [Clostridia bacterium]|nr:YlbF family regulator [Clostridia bacterium]
MNEILKMAQSLGEAIADSEEIKVFREMEKIYNEDEEAQRVMQEYEDSRARMTVKAKETGMTAESLALFQKEMKSSMDKLMANKTVKEYLEAKSNFNEIIKRVNAIISFCIQGEDQELAQEGGCSGNCNACGGCH